MENTAEYLFAYGTLLEEGNEFAEYLNEHSSFYGKGSFEGLLYDVGGYPGTLYRPGCGFYVYGNIYKLNDAETVLKVLDDYEGIDTAQPEDNEYSRQIVTVNTSGGEVQCWVYLYNYPVEAFWQIESGDYISYLNE